MLIFVYLYAAALIMVGIVWMIIANNRPNELDIKDKINGIFVNQFFGMDCNFW